MSRRNIEPEIFGADNFDEYTTHDEPAAKNFYEQHGFDERDGPLEEEEECGYQDDPDVSPFDEGNYRRRY